MECEHKDFMANVAVNRLAESDHPDAQINGFAADITIACADCKLPFHFVGLDAGVSPNKPMVSADSLELRAPIAPGEKMQFHSRIELRRNDGITQVEVEQ